MSRHRTRHRPRAVEVALGLASLGALAVLAPAPGCKGSRPEPEQTLASMDAEGPPHTPNCRSWADLDHGSLPALPEGAHVPAFDEVWKTVANKHFDPTLGCLDWPALRETYGAKVAEAGDDTAAAYAAINELLGLLGQSHLAATPPAADPIDATPQGPAVVPIAVRWLPVEPKSEERAVVIVDAELDGHDSGLPRGAVLTRIGDEPVATITERVSARIHEHGGSQAEVAFTIARSVGVMLGCPENGTKSLTFTADGEERTVDAPCFVPEGERISLGNLRDLPTRVSWRMVGESSPSPAPDEGGEAGETGGPPEPAPAPDSNSNAKIGYLAFNYWMLPMVERIREGIKQMRASGMEALILDLRGNPGGVGAMSVPVARLFVDRPVSLGRLQMRDFNQEFKVDANPDAFAGPIVVLVDEGTASTSEIFALGMADVGRVTVIGAGPSAGMALPSLIETLPDGGLIQYVVGDYHSTKGTAAEGEGVPLDARVEESRVDYAAGRDPVYDAAVAHLEAALRGTPDTPQLGD